MAGRRKERLADEVRAEVSRILLYNMSDPRIGFVTVTGVELSSDMRSAAVKISVMGDEKTQAITMNVIKGAAGFIQKELGRRINTRYVPQVRFELDDSVKRSVRLSKTLREVSEETDGDSK
jgi:ribosome-binding factor A